MRSEHATVDFPTVLATFERDEFESEFVKAYLSSFYFAISVAHYLMNVFQKTSFCAMHFLK
jgi:hypothetical protein